MYTVFILVPTKGWRFVGQYHALDAAVLAAEMFEPLEVRVDSPDRKRSYYGGVPCMPDYSVPACPRTLPRKMVEA